MTRTNAWIYQGRNLQIFTPEPVKKLICDMQVHKYLVHLHHIATEYISFALANSYLHGQNGRHFADDIFQMRFRDWKFLYFDYNLSLRVQLGIRINQNWFR